MLSEHFSLTKILSTTNKKKYVYGNMALPCILNKTAVDFSTKQ